MFLLYFFQSFSKRFLTLNIQMLSCICFTDSSSYHNIADIYNIFQNLQSYQIKQNLMEGTPEALELSHLFRTQLDPSHLGFIAKATFREYMNKQPKPLQYYEIEEIFRHLEDGNKMLEKDFVMFMIGYRKGLHRIAMARLAIGKQLKKFSDASPSASPSQIYDNFIKFQILGKEKPTYQHQESLKITLGKDDSANQTRREEYEKILGHELAETSLIFKFNVTENSQKICSTLETVINEARALASEMLDPQMNEIISMIDISIKSFGTTLYIFAEMPVAFLNDTARFFTELIQSISPSAYFILGCQIKSKQLQKFVDSPGNFNFPDKLKDLSINLSAKFDSLSKSKLNYIFGEDFNKNAGHQEKFNFMLFLLFQEIQLESKFVNTEGLMNELGLKNEILGDFKENLSGIKQLELVETVSQFIPAFAELVDLLKEGKEKKADNQNNGEVSLNFGCLSLRIEYSLGLKGLLNLL